VGSLALHSWGSRTVVTQSGVAPPLSAAERSTLARDGSMILTLPRALREVPDAMSDAARSKAGSPLSRTRAAELLFEYPQLSPLLKAVEHPTEVADSLELGLQPASGSNQVPLVPLDEALLFFVVPGVLAVALGTALRSRRRWPIAQRIAPLVCVFAVLVVIAGIFAPIDNGVAPWNVVTDGALSSSNHASTSTLEYDLAQLEVVYDDIVPALQYAGAVGHQVLNPQSAVQVLVDYPHLSALSGFVTDFSTLYGVGVLISQQAAGSGAAPNASQAMHWLDWVGLLAAVLLLSLGAGVTLMRRRDLVATSTPDADDGLILQTGMAGSGS
jgi:hypothetical protein